MKHILTLLALLALVSARAAEKPNIIVILTDDQGYADLALKEEILVKTRPLKTPPGRYRPGDRLFNFLKDL